MYTIIDNVIQGMDKCIFVEESLNTTNCVRVLTCYMAN